MKIRSALLLALLFLVTVSSCTRQVESLPTEHLKHVEVVLRTQESEYWRTVKMGAEVAAKEFDVTLDFRAPADEADVKGQVALLEQSVASKPDAILLAANDYKALSPAVDEAAKQHIPVVAIDSEVDTPQVRSFIGADHYEAGQQAAAQLIKWIGTTGQIAIVSNRQGDRNTELREQGLLDKLAHYRDIQVLEKVYGSTNRELAVQLTEEVLKNHPGLSGIVALTENASLGAASAIQSRNLQEKVKIITFNSTPEELALMQEGVIQAAIVQNPFSIGYLGVKQAAEASNGHKLPERTKTEIKAIDLTNMFWSDNQKLLFPFIK
ncbi:substrate-binding domain-containing protein [Paenibacillus oryzisoli]|uniref:substrate-binding domain-containing protein n=1 Tax=Paenibacillus oryzisoli TaxID=1850517 RepID=UPI003D2B3D64